MGSVSWQGIRYLVVGGLNVGFTLAVFWLLDRLYSRSIGVQSTYWISAFLGIANGFIWQRVVVWKSRNKWHKEFLKFLTVNIATSVINSLLLFLAVNVAGFVAFPSQVLITGLLVVASFLITRSWVFRHEATNKSQQQLEP